MDSFLTFPADTSSLSSNERQVLEKLSGALKKLVALYQEQKNESLPGANFYPADATREEIQEAAKTNLSILDPYTFVRRDERGGLVAIPYSKVFSRELEEIVSLLREAADLSEDEHFQHYVRARAEDLLRDNFDASNKLWFDVLNSRIGFNIGAFDRHHDKLFYRKRAYAGWVGVLHEEEMRRTHSLRAALLSGTRKYLPGAKQAQVPKIQVRIEETAALGGLDADFLFASNNLPSSADLHLIKEYGTISTIYLPMIRWRFQNWIRPIYERVFAPSFRTELSAEDISRGLFLVSLFDEMTRPNVRYDDAASRLEECYAYIDEAYGDVLAIRSAGYLFLKGLLGEQELKSIVTAETCNILSYLETARAREYMEAPAVGYAMFLDFFLDGGALQWTDQGFAIDFQRASLAIDQLTNVFEYYLALGTREEAREFLKQVDPQKIMENLPVSIKRALAR
ncbi:MAG: hypothetical protein Q8P39_00560 [Candidatus Yanofskybacteria bacterium]|nr:hypothetical protein [Candidatus Yanofskybacteria bacterium]